MCKKEFSVSKYEKNRKYCSHRCFSESNKSDKWRGGTIRGKGSRGKYSKESVEARAKAKVLKHIKEIENLIDVDRLIKIINLKYCNSVALIFRQVLKTKLSTERTALKKFIQYLKFNNFYEKIISIPKFYEGIRKMSPEDFEWFISKIKSCESYYDLRLDVLDKTITGGYRNIHYKNLSPLLKYLNIETNAFDKLGNKRGRRCGTYIEKQVRNFLIELNLPFAEQFKIKNLCYKCKNEKVTRTSYYLADFFVDNCLIIEVNGDYWHGYKGSEEWKQEVQLADKLKYKCYEDKKIPYIIIWEHELKNLSSHEIKNRILQGVLNAKRNYRNSSTTV